MKSCSADFEILLEARLHRPQGQHRDLPGLALGTVSS